MISPIRNMNLYYTPNMVTAMQRLSSMKRINTAKDDAAGLNIATKLQSQYRGHDRVATNVGEMRDLLNTAEGSMDSITNNLQRIRELTLQAGNAAYSMDEKKAIQLEINQLIGDINHTTQTAQFNEMNLLDGTFTNKFVTVNPNGAGTRLSIDSLSTRSLGIDGIDVTKQSTSSILGRIDYASTKVISQRGELGAKINRLDMNYQIQKSSKENLMASDARITGLDTGGISDEINRLNLGKILNSYNFYMQNQRANMMGSFLNFML